MPASVLVGTLLLVGSGVPLVVDLPREEALVGATLPLVAWLALGVAGVVLLDRHPRSRVGWACVAAATTPTFVLGAGYLLPGGEPGVSHMLRVATEWGPLSVAPLVLPLLAVSTVTARSRGDRRWRIWTIAACLLALSVATLAWFAGTPQGYGLSAAAGIGAVAMVVVASAFILEPRPIVEPLVDLGLAATGIAVAAGAGGGVLAVARHEHIFGPEALGAFATAATLALAVPAAWWGRREFLTRRYGTGVISADEMASLTADLTTTADPRKLLTKAGAMVTATSGVGETQLVLDEVPAPEGWEAWRLLVGDDLVGTMLLRPSHPGGLEARQARVCRQLLPTVALVARAVGLAIDAEYARHDLTYQRDLERSRILADLHDDLGPVLAGMSMRVQAAREVHRLPELDDLAEDLAGCRADLRRIVSGLAPVALHHGDLRTAIAQLVESFNGSNVRVTLTSDVPDHLETRWSVVIYRAVAEGITNAMKHAHAAEVSISVEDDASGVRVSVIDDGVGGAIVPGVGLQSLMSRATEVGGALSVEPMQPTGTRLLLSLPGDHR